MDGREPKKTGREALGAAGAAGSSAPAKGDSSGGDVPGDDGATLSGAESAPTGTKPSAPNRNSSGEEPTFVDASPLPTPSAWQARHPSLLPKPEHLEPGDVLGGRYEIVRVLGEGGMGTVYQAMDREVEHLVALKLIRHEMAQHPIILARFKQELLTARQVTHRNVIRIYELSEIAGVKFITMEFVEGCDLRTLLRGKGKLPPEQAVEIIRQVCLALEAAHGVGIIHRDLKPNNIMQDKQGRILVMDFGLARSLESSDGMTQTGALLGTIEYMSPEQAMGKHLDARSDLFTLGLIFYELLSGNMPYKADTAMASLLKRNQERAVPVTELDSSIPKGLSDIVSKCLERDLEQRYQNVQEILADLDAWQGKRPVSASVLTAPAMKPQHAMPWMWIAVGTLAAALAVGGWVFRGKLSAKPVSKVAAGPQVSLAILPFRNGSADAQLDWLGAMLAEMLSTDVGQSAQLRTISPDRLHQILRDLQIPANADLDPETLRRIAELSNADTLVSGQYAKFGSQIRIDATLRDLKHDRSAPLKIEAANENGIPATVDGLAELIRKNLALSPDELKELKASSYQPTSKSPAALRDYNLGVQSMRDGKNLEAQKALEAATKADPAFALAFSRLAQTYSNLGHDNEAGQAAQKAVGLSDNLSQVEKYLIGAIRAQVSRNYPEAIKAYENLAKASPDNVDVQAALASLYEDSGELAKSGEHYQKILAANPKDLLATLATGRIALLSGNAQASLEPLNRALSLSIQVGNDEAHATSLHAIGYAYEILNKPEEAVRNYEQALEIRRRIRDQRGIAKSLDKLARVEVLLGKNKAASAHFEEALQVNREIGDKRGLGDVLVDLGNFYDDSGDHDRSLKLYKESLQIQRDIGNEGLQAICLNNIGSVYFSKGEYQDALTYFQQALQLREKAKLPQDVVESVHNVAETSVRMGQYNQAVSQYMRALELRRSIGDPRGGAIESYSMGTLFDYQGRFGAAVNSKQDALKTFRDLKDRTYWMAEILGGYGQALTLAGRGEESRPYLDEALNLSRELKNEGLVAQTLAFEGDVPYYRGDPNSSRPYYERALQAAAHSKEPDKVLIAKADLAKADLEAGRAAAAIISLRSLVRQAEDQGFAYLAVESSVYMADAMLRNHDGLHARQELERALLQADSLGLKPLSAKAQYLLATALRLSGNQAEAQQHYRGAVQLLDLMHKEAGAEKILQRSDFRAIYEDASHWAEVAKN
jgi:tetratricopeptide (TPR) repeat protein/tRNA A-37 threonylcarbamoyl transferase component Bud32